MTSTEWNQAIPDVVPKQPGMLEMGKEFDTRIQKTMETVNKAIEEVNRISEELRNAKELLKNSIDEATEKVTKLYNSNRHSVDASWPFYVARAQRAYIHQDFINSETSYYEACLQFEDAKENEKVAERVLGGDTDGATDMSTADALENLNKAVEKVSNTRLVKSETEAARNIKQKNLEMADHKVALLEEQLEPYLISSLPYYTLRSTVEKNLESQRLKVQESMKKLKEAKEVYNQSMENVETMSKEMEQRKTAWDFLTQNVPDLSKFEEIEDSGDTEDSPPEEEISSVNNSAVLQCDNLPMPPFDLKCGSWKKDYYPALFQSCHENMVSMEMDL